LVGNNISGLAMPPSISKIYPDANSLQLMEFWRGDQRCYASCKLLLSCYATGISSALTCFDNAASSCFSRDLHHANDSDIVKGHGRYGRLWGRSHKSFLPLSRRLLEVSGGSSQSFLNELVTADLFNAPTPRIPEPEGTAARGIPRENATASATAEARVPVIDWREQGSYEVHVSSIIKDELSRKLRCGSYAMSVISLMYPRIPPLYYYLVCSNSVDVLQPPFRMRRNPFLLMSLQTAGHLHCM
jgi:hypothetical protein